MPIFLDRCSYSVFHALYIFVGWDCDSYKETKDGWVYSYVYHGTEAEEHLCVTSVMPSPGMRRRVWRREGVLLDLSALWFVHQRVLIPRTSLGTNCPSV